MGSAIDNMWEIKEKAYQKKITAARKELAALEKAYESLQVFKRKVEQSHDTFDDVRRGESAILKNLESCKKANDCVDAYVEAIQDFLDSGGTKVVNIAYGALEAMARTQLNKYWRKMEELGDDILEYQDTLDDIQDEMNRDDS